jgi:myo-inositol-1(or 4)-monophosphatase
MILTTALEAAKAAGTILIDIRESGFDTEKKGDRDLVTTGDLAAERCVIDLIRTRFPDHTILSEEASPETTTSILNHDAVWIIDPIDGTTNFAHGHFMVAVSIAFASRGKIQAGVVHAPFLNETFAAQRGEGATLNGKKILCGEKTSLTDSLVATGFPYDRTNITQIVSRIEKVLKNCRDVRRAGSAALDTCWVACGRLDAYYETCKVWDIAAGALIAREAGARTGNLGEIPPDWCDVSELYPEQFLVARPGVFEAIHRLLK